MKTSHAKKVFTIFLLLPYLYLFSQSAPEKKVSTGQVQQDVTEFQTMWQGESGFFRASETIEDPLITLIDDAAVILEYASVYDVHTPPDPVTYPNMRSQPAHFDKLRILADLETVIDPENYDFVLLYTLQEVPGWIKNGIKYFVAAENIGLPNSGFSTVPPEHWSKLRSVCHMNSVDLLDRSNPAFPDLPNYGSTLTAFHEMGHFWCVYIPVNSTIGPADWDPTLHPVGYLAACGAHWAGIWEGEGLPGIMLSGPNSTQFNAFDLYLMGLLGYKGVSDTVYQIPNNSTGTRIVYDVTIDSLIDAMSLAGTDYFTYIGHRYPDLDPEVTDLHTLIVVVQGRDESITELQRERVIALAHAIPGDWHHATWELSNMDVHIDIKDDAEFSDQYQTHIDYGYWLREVVVRWQEFIPRLNVLYALELYLKREGSAGNILIEIRTLDDTIVSTAILNESDIPVSDWVRIEFPDNVALVPGEKYRIAVYTEHESTDPDNRYFWRGTNDALYNHTCVSSEYERNPEFDFAFRTFGTFMTGIEDNREAVPASSLLVRNYPNPFNTTTTIEYSVANRGIVHLKIYDSKGREVRTLVNEDKLPGVYQTIFDASGLSSGMYFCNLKSGPCSKTGKLLFLK